MIGEKPKGLRARLVMTYPALMLGIFFIVPFCLMAAVSFFHRQPGGFYVPGFELSNYRNLCSALFGRTLLFSLLVAGLSAALCVSIGFPFTYFITRMKRRAQVVWLVLLMSVLSLSEVIVGFAWSLLLSRTAGLSNIFVWLGLMERPMAWYPGFVALIFGICYLAFPYTVLVLYPPLSRLDPALPEAAQTLGASPARTFLSVIVGSLRNAIVAAFVMVFVFTLGVYLLPQILGRPRHWTLSVLITDAAIYQTNMPLAAAMAIFFMFVSLVLVALTMMVGKGKRIDGT
jgi:putative spermidine/putrescine transport system permease protein